MSRVINGAAARDMPFQTISRNMNNPSAYQVQCKCTRPLGSLGQYKPDDAGRRIMRCDDATPEQNAQLLRRMKLAITPQFMRTSKGCGAITIVGPTGQILRVFEKGTEQHTALNDKLEIVRLKKDGRSP